MSYSPAFTSAFTGAKNRSALHSSSGMCSFCTEDCIGTCELGLAAVLGAQTVYPTTTGNNQVASEKDYPIDYSHFNINGHVFGAMGATANAEETGIFSVKMERSYGTLNKVKLAIPLILPALIKLNWRDYFSGAAMAGVSCVIGEGSASRDDNAEYEDGKIVKFDLLKEMLDSFNKYYRGYGQIILQCNGEDNLKGLPELAITKYGLEALEFKFGQSAKGVQPAKRIASYEDAVKAQQSGAIVYPDPSSPEMIKANGEDCCPNFYSYDRLPFYDLEYLSNRITYLRSLGLENVYFKMAAYDPVDLEKVLRLASELQIDMVTFDGAGGGSGYSPCKMMNEWAYPTVCMEKSVCDIVATMKKEGLPIPAISITGGIASEDQVFKALAFGGNDITAVGVCRSAMAAAMSGKKIGEMIKAGNVPPMYQKYGSTVEEIFADLKDLKYLYGKKAVDFPTGAIGVYSYLNKLAFGIQHFAALNRKFDIDLLDSSDLIPLTRDAKDLQSGKWFK